MNWRNGSKIKYDLNNSFEHISDEDLSLLYDFDFELKKGYNIDFIDNELYGKRNNDNSLHGCFTSIEDDVIRKYANVTILNDEFTVEYESNFETDEGFVVYPINDIDDLDDCLNELFEEFS